MHQHFHWRGIKADIALYIGSCDSCQRSKLVTLDLPEMQAPAIYGPLWHVHVDLAGPFRTPQYDLNGQPDASLPEIKAWVVMIVDYFTPKNQCRSPGSSIPHGCAATERQS